MKNTFPSQENPIVQVNRGDSIGSLWSSKNIDLQSNYGVFRLAPRLLLGASLSTDATFGLPVAIKEFDSKFWAMCGAKIYTNSGEPSATWSADASTGFQADYSFESDMETFNNVLYATNNSGLYGKIANASGTGAWTQRVAAPNAGLLQYFRKFNRLYISDSSNKFESIDTAEVPATAGDYTISLPAGFDIQCSCETTDSIWIGTLNTENLSGRGSIFRWDGISLQSTERYYISGNEILSIIALDDIPHAIDSFGILYRFTGSAFKEIGRLPFGKHLPLRTSSAQFNERYVHRHGMQATKDGTILVAVGNLWELSNSDQVIENLPSGVWEWSEEFGMTHKFSFGYTPRITTTITDWGQFNIFVPGALFYTAPQAYSSTSQNGTILVGANYYTDNDTSSTVAFGLFYDDSTDLIQKKGYFVTKWYKSFEIQDKWERLWTTYRRFLNSTDSIVMKFRIYEEAPEENISITWVNTTSFTTTTDVSAYGPDATGFNGSQGGEVEILQGVGGGLCAHITDVSEAGGTYTVTIDEVATGATTTTARARFQKWIKLNPAEAQDQLRSYSQMAIGKSNVRIQIKCCLTFTGEGEFNKMVLVSNEDIQITK